MKLKKIIFDILSDIAGSFLYAIGIFCFFESAAIAPGGVSGIAIMAKYIINFPVGIFSVIANIPLMAVALKKVSQGFVLKSVKSLLIGSLILDMIVTPYFPIYQGDRMIASIFGGIFAGTGMALIFMRGSSTGGTDILSVLIEKKFPHIQIGTAMMIVDFIIVAVSVIVFQDVEAALYGVVAIFCQTRVIDALIYGLNKGRQILIISKKNEEIAKSIINEIKRGATFIPVRGAYENKEGLMLLCVVRRSEYYPLKNIIHNIDPGAFVVTAEASQILGEGFEPIIKKR